MCSCCHLRSSTGLSAWTSCLVHHVVIKSVLVTWTLRTRFIHVGLSSRDFRPMGLAPGRVHHKLEHHNLSHVVVCARVTAVHAPSSGRIFSFVTISRSCAFGSVVFVSSRLYSFVVQGGGSTACLIPASCTLHAVPASFHRRVALLLEGTSLEIGIGVQDLTVNVCIHVFIQCIHAFTMYSSKYSLNVG